MKKEAFTVSDVKAAGYTLTPLVCPSCGSTETVFLQYVSGGCGACQECGAFFDETGVLEER